jgi:type VI protein secretion system component Hcp
MAIQMMMKIDGVEGEASSFKHKGWADVISWSWGMTSNRKLSEAIDGDKTSLNELSIVKAIASDSSGIRLLYAQGKTIPCVKLTMFPAVAKREVPKDYVDIKLEDVLIKSIVTGGGVDDAFFKEHITLLFDKIKFEYNNSEAKKNEDGTKVSTVDFEWNVSDNAEWKQTSPTVLQEVI